MNASDSVVGGALSGCRGQLVSWSMEGSTLLLLLHFSLLQSSRDSRNNPQVSTERYGTEDVHGGFSAHASARHVFSQRASIHRAVREGDPRRAARHLARIARRARSHYRRETIGTNVAVFLG